VCYNIHISYELCFPIVSILVFVNIGEQGRMNFGTQLSQKKRKYSDKILTERVKALSFSIGETAQATCKIQEPY